MLLLLRCCCCQAATSLNLGRQPAQMLPQAVPRASVAAALQLLRRAKRQGLEPDLATYSALLHLCARSGQGRTALALHRVGSCGFFLAVGIQAFDLVSALPDAPPARPPHILLCLSRRPAALVPCGGPLLP